MQIIFPRLTQGIRVVTTIFISSLFFTSQIHAATEGAGDNDTADAAGVVTVSVPDTLEGNLCREDDFLSSPCAPSDPADVWSITNGTSGNVTLTWTSAVQVQIQSYVDSARTDPNGVAPVAITSGMAESLNGSLFYSVIITPQAGDTNTAYNVALAAAGGGGNTAPTASSFTASNGPFQSLTYTFSTADFGYSDADMDTLSHILIEALPGAGTLYVDADDDDTLDMGEEVSVSDQITKANLDAGHLQFINTTSSNSTFQFEVNDGTEDSTGNYLATLNMTPIPSVTLSLGATSVAETTATSPNITATLSNAYGANTVVTLAYSGTATSAADYTPSTSITVNAGSTSNSTNVTIIDDPTAEGLETIIIDITSVTNGTENGVQQQTLTIADDENTAPTATGFPLDVTVTEDTASDFDLSAVTFADANGDSLTVTITVVEGTFSTPADGSAVGSGVDETLVSTTTITLAGTAADINTYLSTPSNIQYTGVNNQSGVDSTTYSVNANDGIANPQVGVGDVDITGVNDAPESIGFNTSLEFATNITGVNAVLDTVGATDIDGPFPIALSLVSAGTATTGGTCTSDADNASFNIDGTNFRSSSVLSPAVYNICVQAADAAMPSLSFKQSFAITIDPVEATSTAAAFNSVTGANLTPSFNFGDNDETLTIADPSHITGSNMNGRGGSDILVVPNGSDLTTGNVTQIETLQIASGATVTMTEAQYELFSTITAPGTETLVLGTVNDGSVTANDDIENYQLNGAYTFNPAPLGNGVTVTGDSNVQTFNVSDGSDTYTGGGGNDIFRGSSSALASDTITDLSVGDVIVITGELIGAADVALSGDGNTIEIKSNPSLPADVFIGLGGMGNVAINTVTNDGMDTTITFQAETIAPTFDGGNSTPADNAAAVSVSSNIVLDFSENIQLVGGNTITLRDVTNNATRETFTASSTTAGTGSSGGSVSVSADKITLNPGSDLQAGTQYAVQIASTTVEDLAGNDFAGISDDTTYNLTTAPELVISADLMYLDEASDDAIFTVALQDGNGNAFTATENVSIAVTASGDATGGGVDYSVSGLGSSNEVTIATGTSSASFTLTTEDDGSTGESTETATFTLAASPLSGTATIGSSNSASVMIIENASPVITGVQAGGVSGLLDSSGLSSGEIELVFSLANNDVIDGVVQELTFSATDSDNDPLTWSITSDPTVGTAAVQGTNGGSSSSFVYVVTGAERDAFTSDSVTIQVTDGESSPVSVVVNLISVPQKALNDIADFGLATVLPSESPDTATYTRAGVTGVTDGAVLDLINNAVRMIAQASGVSMDISAIDTAAELQVIVNAILEGQDEDGDGLPNIFEGSETVDTDGDGTPDRRDTDSDNDGIGDVIDSGVFLVRDAMTNVFTLDVADSDNDNIADVFDADVNNDGSLNSPASIDSNYDGVDDRWDTVQKVLDAIANDEDDDGVPALIDGDDNDVSTGDALNSIYDDFRQLMILNGDGDSSANYVDLDSDNDGVLDVNEYGTPGERDQNMDALLDAGQQVVTEIQPLIDLGVAINADNDDDLVNHLDVNSDGSTNDIESVFTAEERRNSRGLGVDVDQDGRLDSTIDFDRDGIVFFIVTANSPSVTIDNSEIIYGLQVPIANVEVTSSSFSTSVQANGWLASLCLMVMLLLKMRKVVIAIGLLLVSLSSSAEDWADKLQWQVAIGQSEFDLDITEPGFSKLDNNDHQYSLALGYQFHENWLAQLRYSELGSIQITDTVSTASIDYDALTLNVQAILPVFEESPVDVYSVIGVTNLNRGSSTVTSAEDEATNAMIGAGIKGDIDNMTLSLELNSFSEEVWAWSIGVGGHF